MTGADAKINRDDEKEDKKNTVIDFADVDCDGDYMMVK